MRRNTTLFARLAGAATGLVLAVAAVVVVSTPAQAASLTQVTGFGSNPGNLAMYAYRPDNLPANAPAVVLLHGCTQNATTYFANTGWQKFADQWKFTVIVAGQSSANQALSCFNWFVEGDIRRGQGEALSIKQMVDHAKANYGTDSGRVFVSGLSAGGAMSAVMLATYPDVFRAGSVIAGLPYRCSPPASTSTCQNSGVDKTPAAWGDLVRAAYPGYSGPYPRVSIWHGTSDYVVVPANATELRDQWTNVRGVSQTPTGTESLPANTSVEVYGKNDVRVQRVSGMGHGTPVDPGSAANQCGTAGAYVLDTICSTYYDAIFFGLNGGGNPTPNPTPTTGPTPPPTPTPTASPTPPPTTSPTCVTASNYAHVTAGRAYQSGGYAYANGSQQRMGLYNTFYTSTLKQTGPNYWVIGC